MADEKNQNKSPIDKCIQVHTLTLSSLHPSIQLCAVKSLTPAVVVSWFKESVITSGDELACEYQQHRVEGGCVGEMGGGQSWDGPWRGKPDLL